MTDNSVDFAQQFHQACQLHESGELEAARLAYLSLLSEQPEHAEVLHRLGNIELRYGQLQSAEQRVARALQLQPDAPGYQITLGNILRAAQRPQEALAAYRAELAARPDFAIAHQQVGLMMLEGGEPAGAVRSLLKAVEHAPDLASAHNYLGRALNNLGNFPQAANAFLSAIERQPHFPEAYNNLGHVLRAQGNMRKAAEAFTEAVRQDPADTRAQHNLGTALAALNDAPGAVQAFKEAIRLDPDNADACHNLAVVLHDKGLLDQALEYYDKALSVDATRADTLSSRGAALQSMGAFTQAQGSYEAALQVHANLPAALAGLAGLLHMQGRDQEGLALLEPRLAAGMRAPEVLGSYADMMRATGDTAPARALLTQIMSHPRLTADQQLQLHFKMGDLCDADGDYDLAFEHYQRANGLKRTGFDPDKHAQQIDRLIVYFDAERCAGGSAPLAEPSQLPVFIVGMPRSGTSLVEQIVASHSQVFGAGELNHIGAIVRHLVGQHTLGTQAPLGWPELLDQVPAQRLGECATEYLMQLRAMDRNALRISDKMWLNFEHLGLIAQLFPGARVLHCTRDPLDTALSCYFHNFFQTIALPFSYRLADIGEYYLDYVRLMDHWRKALPLRMLDVPYEALVAEQGPISRALIDFLELPWDEACLRFHETPRVALTASYAQVKKPMYSSSVGRWRHYERHLAPLRKVLDGAVQGRPARWTP